MMTVYILESAFLGRLASLSSSLKVGHCREGEISSERLVEQELITRTLYGFSCRYPEANRQSLVVLWSRLYTARLLAASAVPALVIDWYMPVSIADCYVMLDEETGNPLSIRVMGAGIAFRTNDPFRRFSTLVWQHLHPFVLALAQYGRTSAKLLWANIAIQFESLVQRIFSEMHSLDRFSSCDARLLFHTRYWSSGQLNPLFEPWLPMPAGYLGPRRRKACCLYYKLKSGNKLCGNCPIGIKQEKVQA